VKHKDFSKRFAALEKEDDGRRLGTDSAKPWT
jgi:hypothetical protein